MQDINYNALASKFSAKYRSNEIEKISNSTFDLIIIGGGITGGGILLDAASRGLNAILIEKSDFSSGTSSKSTKLIHGGLRYLKKFEFNLVRKVGKERKIANSNAPHLVLSKKMLLPIYKNGNLKKWQTRLALKIYDFLAGVKGNERYKILNTKATIQKENLLKSDNLLGAGYYAEYTTDDSRLTLEVIKTAITYGASAINYCKASKLLKYNNKISGVSCQDLKTENIFNLYAKNIINASGPWVDKICRLDSSSISKNICHSLGIHIVIDKAILSLKNPVYFDTDDGRMCFAIPKEHVTYVGTTDTIYNSDIENLKIEEKDIYYLIKAINNAFSMKEIDRKDVISAWAGLRPLIFKKNTKTSELSRKDELIISDSGLITIAGGKLTGYRLMAKKVVDKVCNLENLNKKCKTRQVKLIGSEFIAKFTLDNYYNIINKKLEKFNLDKNISNYLVSKYGSQSEEIINIFNNNKLKHIVEAEAIFCIKYENTHTLLDFFLRRSGKIYYNPKLVINELKIVSAVFKDKLNINDNNIFLQEKEVKESLIMT